ncbi:RNA-dependent RNA polymerase 1 [Corchorus olitorius]|uniref:RNA-dependent RNA polymerase 1 n=1 Tax=Corchorus olitorius TaxID=93759 RepID=A0A1R3KS15_9ROSI|nr:RNA-dependent RNA polymerase 1 [Corchorus olitorius]
MWPWELHFTDSYLIGQSTYIICLGLSLKEEKDDDSKMLKMEIKEGNKYSYPHSLVLMVWPMMPMKKTNSSLITDILFGINELELSWSKYFVSTNWISEKCSLIQHYHAPQLSKLDASKISSVTITPSKVYLMQQTRMPNRTIRQYGEKFGKFLYVNFTDEDDNNLNSSMLSCKS